MKHTQALGAGDAQDAVLDLDRDAHVRWLAESPAT